MKKDDLVIQAITEHTQNGRIEWSKVGEGVNRFECFYLGRNLTIALLRNNFAVVSLRTPNESIFEIASSQENNLKLYHAVRYLFERLCDVESFLDDVIADYNEMVG